MRLAVDHPQLRNDLGDELAVAKQAHDRALGNHHRKGLSRRAHVRARDMAAAQPEGERDLWRDRMPIPAGRNDNSIGADDKCAIEL